MTRLAIVSLAIAMLATAPGCQRKPTNAPEAPAAKKTDFSPPEEYELAGADGEEENAPGLGGG